MKIIFKSIVLLSLITVLLAMWVPHFIAGSIVSADSNSKGTTIGGIEVGDLEGAELKTVLLDAVNEWHSHNLTISGGGTTVEVSSSTFQFDINSTIDNYESNYEKPWYAFWKSETVVHLPLNIIPNEIVKNEISNISTWDTDLTYENVELNAAYLKTDPIEAVVKNFTTLETDRISLSVEAIPEGEMGLNELILALNDTVLEPQIVFSMTEQLGDAINLANREAINFMASNIYNAALNINAEILERHSQNNIPSYLKPGLEAKVDALANKDLKFVNTTSKPVVLKLSMDQGELLTEVYTPAKEVEVSVIVSRDEEIQPRTITRYSGELAIGQTEQLQEGVGGLRVSVYRTVNGEQQLVSRDYYSPINRIILKSSQQEQASNVIPNDPIDLDGDGFPDEDLSGSSSPTENSNSVTGNSESEENLKHGSYYDKGGNLITP